MIVNRSVGVRLVAVALAVAIPTMMLLGCGRASEEPREIPATSLERAADHPPRVEVQAVVDPSLSVPRRFLWVSLRVLARVVAGWPAEPDAEGSPARPALHFSLRGVSARSFEPGTALLTGIVPSIVEVPPLPETAEGDLTEVVVAHEEALERATKQYGVASSEALQLADRIRKLRPRVTKCSDVAGAVSAAAQTFSTSGTRIAVIISDLLQTCHRNVAGRLHDVEVVVGLICWRAASCRRVEGRWRTFLEGRGAQSVQFVRVENVGGAFRDRLGGV